MYFLNINKLPQIAFIVHIFVQKVHNSMKDTFKRAKVNSFPKPFQK